MAYINLSKNEYEIKKQSELTVTFSTDVTLTDVKLSVDNGSTFRNCKRFTQSSATFDVSSLTNGTYTCKIKGYYSGGNNGSGSTVSVSGVSVSPTTLTLNKGESSQLTATVSPSNATNKSVTWSTNNSSVATVNNGLVTYVGQGNATITATTVDGNKTATCNVVCNSSTASNEIITGSGGFEPNGSLNNISSFTHTETYIPFSGNENATIVFGVEGWTRCIFYNSNKGVIGRSDSTSAVKSITMSQLKSVSPSAVYARVSINQSTTITLTGGSVGATSLTEAEEVVR